MHRVQLDMGEVSFARLRRLRDRAEATSYAEVVRTALALYEVVQDECAAGSKVFVRTPSGQEKYIILGSA